MVTVALRLPYFVGIWYTFRNILQIFFVLINSVGEKMVHCSLGLNNSLQAVSFAGVHWR